MLTETTWAVLQHGLKLSARELQIVRAVFDNETESAIASNLGISSHTVHTHMERLHHKLAVHDRVTLVLRIMSEILAAKRIGTVALRDPEIRCPAFRSGRCPLLN